MITSRATVIPYISHRVLLTQVTVSPMATPRSCAVLPGRTLQTTPFPFLGPASSRNSVNPNLPSPNVTYQVNKS